MLESIGDTLVELVVDYQPFLLYDLLDEEQLTRRRFNAINHSNFFKLTKWRKLQCFNHAPNNNVIVVGMASSNLVVYASSLYFPAKVKFICVKINGNVIRLLAAITTSLLDALPPIKPVNKESYGWED
ncbi:hypothetical protein V6N11_034720 [Hibiscus sabdariffa]|uniref:RNase III domain-containing protein n=1 Tax=Hibiscus sabdariffa TaxID=183260 RepID=A0ABR2NE18_9ROSI